MNLKPREFMLRSMIMLIFISWFFILDTFIPIAVYNNLFGSYRVFRELGVILTLTLMVLHIIYLVKSKGENS